MAQKLVYLFILLIGTPEKASTCTEIRQSQIITYHTRKQAIFSEGALTIPLVLDLVQETRICGEKFRSDTLAALFHQNLEKQETMLFIDDGKSRKKRILPLILTAGAVGVGWLIWEKISYDMINEKIEQLREENKAESHYIKRQMLNAQNEAFNNFLAVKREMKKLSARAVETACNLERNLTYFIIENQLMSEFDDLIASLRNERFTSKIIPPQQLFDLIKALPQLHDSLYIQFPYLLYQTGKVSFNFAEVSGSCIRGALTIPLLKRREAIQLHVATKLVDGNLVVFKPNFIAENSKLSVENCKEELIDTYFCTETDLQPAKFIALRESYIYENGVVLLNNKKEANSRSIAKNNTLQKVIGPAICTTAESSTIIIDNRIIHLQVSEFHVKKDIIEFNVVPYPVNIILETKSTHELENQWLQNDEKYKTLHKSHFATTLALTAVVLLAAGILFFKLRNHQSRVTRLESQELPLKEILVVTDPQTEPRVTKTMTRA